MIMVSGVPRYLISKCFRTWDKVLKFSPARHRRQRQVEAARQKNRPFVAYVPAVGCKMIVDPDTFFSRVYVLGSYEPHLVRYLKEILQPGMTCIDAGANVGYFTLLMAKRVGPMGRVIAFEPTQHTFDILLENVQLNSLKHVTVEQLALFAHDGILQFHEGPPGFEVYNSAGEITHPSAARQAFTARIVRCSTLDTYLNTHWTNKVEVIKLDVEGAELLVLKGMEDTLQANPQLKLIIEFADQTTRGHGYSARDLGIWLVQTGWQLSVINPFGKVHPVSVEEKWSGQMVVASRRLL
jgi:FkbM family methyltransferase